MLILTKHEET